MTMRLPDAADSFTRGAALARMLLAGKTLTAEIIMAKFGVSWATAKRDLIALECLFPVEVEGEGVQKKRVRLMQEGRCAA